MGVEMRSQRMRSSVLTLAAALAITSSTTSFASSSKVIYGEDNRQDLFEATDTMSIQLAQSTAALFKRNRLSAASDGNINLRLFPYANAYNLCSDEKFYSQNSGAFCSGTLVGPDLMLTAGHCIRTQADCASTAFVFGFAVTDASGQAPQVVNPNQVRYCTRIISTQVQNTGHDYAVVQINAPVTDRTPLRINRTGQIATGTSLVMIGHPSGLPTKIAGGATVRNTTRNGYFVANTDSYGGNSGSAVFNAETGLIEGILVRGETDFEVRPGDSCTQSKVCTNQGCRGEDITNISVVSSFIPE